MSRKFSLAYLTVPGATPVEQIEIAAECGYDYVSLRLIPMNLPGEPIFKMEENPALFAAAKEALRKTGVKLLDLELARVREDLDITAYEAAFEKAAELGATDVLSSIWTDKKDFYTDQFASICDMAAKYKLTVNLEFVPFAGLKNLEEALELLNEVKRGNARIMVDTLHAHRCRVTSGDLAKVPRELFGFIHICDGPSHIPAVGDPDMIGVARAGRLYLGEGGIDMAGMLKAMPPNVCSIELPNESETSARGRLEHARRCLKTAKAFFEAHEIE